MTIDPEDYLEPQCPLEEPCGCRHEHAHGSGPGAEYTHGNGCDCGHDHEEDCCNHDHGAMPHRNQPRRIPMREVIEECDRLFNSEKMVELGEHLRK